MPFAFSAYLEIIRLFAALMVFAHHASYPRFDGDWIFEFSGYGHESVVVFFVLSGYVIAFSCEYKDLRLQQYVASRLSRLWSVALPTIILTLIMDAVGRNLSPESYLGLCKPNFVELFASIFFLNEVWFAQGCLGTNIPYWSLSYEFIYYFLFAIYAFVPYRFLVLSLVAIFVGPKVLLLLPCWIMGVTAFQLGKHNLSSRQAVMLSVGGLLLFVVFVFFKIGNNFVTWRLEEFIGPIWSMRLSHSTTFISDNFIGAFFACHLIGMTNLLRAVPVAKNKLALLQRLASATFAIYLIHYPCLIFFTALSLHISGKVYGVYVGICSLAIPILFTSPTEAFKRKLRRILVANLP